MNGLIATYLTRLISGQPQQYENMGVIPLFSSMNHSPEYLTLTEALGRNLVIVSEIGASGSVPELRVTNRAEIPVLLIDGEELVGAKQNRVLNASILIRPKTETIIPVSCTEAGRWGYTSRRFTHSGHIMSHVLRKQKTESVTASLHHSQNYASDQGSVWEGVAMFCAHAAVNSPTSAMNDVYEAKRANLENYLKSFKIVPEQKGLLVLINGRVAGFDLVSSVRAYEALHSTLVKSYAIDALLDRHVTQKPALRSLKAAHAFLKRAVNCTEQQYPSPGCGSDHRLAGKQVAGSALVVDDAVVHLAVFHKSSRLSRGDKTQ